MLRFLAGAMGPTGAAELTPLLGGLAPGLEASLANKYFKVVAEAMRVVEGAAGMVAAAEGDAGADVVAGLLPAVLGRLKGGDQDQEVKEHAIRCAPELS